MSFLAGRALVPGKSQHVDERALATCWQTIPLWLRYVDDTSTAVHRDEIDDFHDHLNKQNADIKFTKEIEENGKLPFPDCLVRAATTNYDRCTENRRIPTDYLTNHPTARLHTKPRL